MNNAALYGDWDMGDQSYEYLKKVVDVNQHSVWLMSHAAAPKMVEGGGGRIINQASGAAYNYVSPFRPEAFNGMGTFNYQIAKWGVVGLTKFMAGSLGTWGITVNCIAPGVIDTEATRKAVPGAITRFASVGNFSSYCRCVDSRRESNGKKKGEGNAKNCNKYLAWAFVEAANFALRYCPEAKRFYERKKRKTNGIVALKAIAHKLARACYHMLREQKPFDVQRCFV